MTPSLQFHSVHKTFNKRGKRIQALKGISFSIGEGEVFGFVGPNGAGKSTTIKVLLDVINDYEGEVNIYGKSSRLAESRRDLAYLPEAPALYEEFTPLELLKMALRMYGIKHQNEDGHCMRWLERFSVAQNAKRRIRQLSKGNVQRVALAHALVVEPRLLVLDEPLSGLDPVGRKDVIDILQEYKEGGGAIFFTSHVLHDVERIADRFGFINEGELVTTRSPQELVTGQSETFVVRFRAPGSDLAQGTQLRANEYEHHINQTELPQWLEGLTRDNGQLISIKPALSLENVFFQILEEKKQANS